MPADEPTLGEVARTLERFERSTNSRLAELATSISLMVTRDLYEAHRAAMQDDITDIREQLKTEQERRVGDKRSINGAFISAGLSLLVAIVSAALLIAFGLKGS
jgi:Flp pilus assembly protein TadB